MTPTKNYFKKVGSGTMKDEALIFQEWAQQIEAWRKLTLEERRQKSNGRAEECLNCCWMSLDFFAQCLCPEPCIYATGDKKRKSYFRPINLKPYLKELSPIWRNV